METFCKCLKFSRFFCFRRQVAEVCLSFYSRYYESLIAFKGFFLEVSRCFSMLDWILRKNVEMFFIFYAERCFAKTPLSVPVSFFFKTFHFDRIISNVVYGFVIASSRLKASLGFQ